LPRHLDERLTATHRGIAGATVLVVPEAHRRPCDAAPRILGVPQRSPDRRWLVILRRRIDADRTVSATTDEIVTPMCGGQPCDHGNRLSLRASPDLLTGFGPQPELRPYSARRCGRAGGAGPRTPAARSGGTARSTDPLPAEPAVATRRPAAGPAPAPRPASPCVAPSDVATPKAGSCSETR